MIHGACEEVNTLLKDYAERNGISKLKLASNNTCGIKLKDGSLLCFEFIERQQSLFVYTPLYVLSNEEKNLQSLAVTLLELNFLGLGADLGIFAIRPTQHQVIYQIKLEGSLLNVNKLIQVVDIFMEKRFYFIKIIESILSKRSVSLPMTRNHKYV